jgi:hypothetical protein
MARVDFLRHRQDMNVLLLGSLGFSTGYIAGKCGLSMGQVLYRLKQGSVKRMDYRNGDSSAAGLVVRRVEASITNSIRDRLLGEANRHYHRLSLKGVARG